MKIISKVKGKQKKIIAIMLTAVMVFGVIGGYNIALACTDPDPTPTPPTILTTKTATLLDESNRTYRIDLSTWTNGDEVITTNTNNDIVLVLDRSASMNQDYTYEKTYDKYSTVANPAIGENYYVLKNSEYNEITLAGSDIAYIWSYTRSNGEIKIIDDSYKIYTAQNTSSTQIPYGSLVQGQQYYIQNSNGHWKTITSTPTNKYYYLDASGNEVYISDDMYTKQQITENVTESRFEALIYAAKQFVEKVAATSPTTNIAVISYAGSVTVEVGFTNVGTHEETILNEIDGIYQSDSTTRTDLALNRVYNLLTQNSNDRTESVVLFTDGVPSTDGSFNNTVATNALTQATNIKNLNATIYTIGLLEGLASGVYTQAYNFLTQVASKDSNNNALYYELNDGFNITDAFNAIVTNVYSTVSGAEIIDYIDIRFVLTNDSKQSITAAGGTYGVDPVTGLEYVKWSGVSIPNINSGKWNASIILQAKDDFIGGNAVPTNTSESGVYLDTNADGNVELVEAFDLPTVNVPILAATSNSGSKTIFYGDTLTLDKVKEILLDTVTDSRVKSNIESFLATGTSGTTRVNYSYGGSEFGELAFTLNTDLSNFDSSVESSKNYTLQVDYTPYTQFNRMTTLGAGYTPPSNNEVPDVVTNLYNLTYNIGIVKGELTINRTINEQYTSSTQPNANQSFVYRIERYSDLACTSLTDTYYEVLSFSANAGNIEQTAIIKGLKKGYYKIVEESNWSYRYNSSTVDTLYIGNETSANVFFGQEGSTGNLKASAAFGGVKKSISCLGDVASMVIK